MASGKSWIWPGHRSRVGARIRACDTSIASSRRAESIGTGLAGNICEYRDLWLPENPGFGQVTDHASGLGSGRVIRQSLPLGETRRLVPVSLGTFASTGIYGFRKSGKSWIWPGHRSRVGARIRACDTSIASSRRAESIGTGLAGNICEYRFLWLPEIRKILDDQGRRQAEKPRGQSYGILTS
ncbi:hypothetical protein DdX_06683 [Ditylenchus destructor]|uniref:Uncharacterized protein n=1 Tax=Ditylenchus destructor TaxID=166010 RepID=A0AAD4R5Y4_9BILA|nr:hypothetical protein DdX_06683 [Ditylenchus destructor]